MPSKNGDASMLRRSPRAPRVKVKFGEEPEETKRGRKKRNSNISKDFSPSPSRRRAETLPVEMAVSAVASSRKKNTSNRAIDEYCWLCHREGQDQICAVCPRVFHFQCLNARARFTEEGHCPECRMNSVDGTEMVRNKKHKLSEMLLLILKKMTEKMPLFKVWGASDIQNQKLVSIMDLSMLQDRLEDRDMQHKTTAAFLADLKWIQHNCHIAYGPMDQLTIKAKLLINECKNELMDLEACPDCYVKSHSSDEDSFASVCENLHTLVWAKMKGFPYWPAKVLKVTDSVANIRFFGTHDKGKVAISQCYLLSDTSPNDKTPKKANFTASLTELKSYISNVLESGGQFHYAEPKTRFDPGNANYSTKPSKRALPPKAPTPKAKRTKTTNAVMAIMVPELYKPRNENIRVPDLIDISAELNESGTEQSCEAQEDDIEIIEEQNIKRNFLGTLELRRSENPSIPIINLNCSRETVDHGPTRLGNVELQFTQGENPEVMRPNNLLPDAALRVSQEVTPLSSEPAAQSVVHSLLTTVSGAHPYHDCSSRHENPFIQNHNVISQEAVAAVQGTSASNNIIASGLPDHDVAKNLISSDELNRVTRDYCKKIIIGMNMTLQEMYIDALRKHENCVSSLQAKTQEIEQLKTINAEIKENTDFVVENMRGSFEKNNEHVVAAMKLELEEKMKTEFEKEKKQLEEKMKEESEEEKKKLEEKMKRDAEEKIKESETKIKESEDKIKESEDKIKESEGKVKESEEKIKELEEKVKKELDDKQKIVTEIEQECDEKLKAKDKESEEALTQCRVNWADEHTSALREMEQAIKAQCKREKDKAVESAITLARKKWRKETESKVSSVKRNQWCAHCLKEARFFCCWNTSYCDEECQRNHWIQHMENCENRAGADEAYMQASVVIPETKTADGKKSKKSDNTNGQTLPTLRLNGQPAPRFINSGTNVSVSMMPPPASRMSVVTVSQKDDVKTSSTNMPPKKAYRHHAAVSSPKTPDSKPSNTKSGKDTVPVTKKDNVKTSSTAAKMPPKKAYRHHAAVSTPKTPDSKPSSTKSGKE